MNSSGTNGGLASHFTSAEHPIGGTYLELSSSHFPSNSINNGSLMPSERSRIFPFICHAYQTRIRISSTLERSLMILTRVSDRGSFLRQAAGFFLRDSAYHARLCQHHCLRPQWHCPTRRPASSLSAYKVVDITLFFLINYASHAATVKSIPGEKVLSKLFNVAPAFLFPYSGILRGFEALARHGIFYRNHLDRAVRSGALCIVVRTRSWVPKNGYLVKAVREREDIDNQQFVSKGNSVVEEEVATRKQTAIQTQSSYDEEDGSPAGRALGPSSDETRNRDSLPDNAIELTSISCPRLRIRQPCPPEVCASYEVFVPRELDTISMDSPFSSREVQGLQALPEGYGLAILPPNAIVVPKAGGKDHNLTLPSSQNIPKGIVAVVQAIYSGVTLYGTSQDQLRQFGYAAFGLTVLPYFIMSIINLFGNLATPDYPALFLVSSPELEEADEGVSFEGVVGKVVEATELTNFCGKFEFEDHGSITFRPIIRDTDDQHQPPTFRITERPYRDKLVIPSYTPFRTEGPQYWNGPIAMFCSSFIVYILGAIPYAVIGCLTHFHPAHSTLAQRVLTMLWLALDVTIGSIVALVKSRGYVSWMRRTLIPICECLETAAFSPRVVATLRFSLSTESISQGLSRKQVAGWQLWILRSVTLNFVSSIIISLAAPVRGFVIVGMMLQSYGSCTRFS